MLKRLSELSLRYGLIPFAHNIIRLYLCLIRVHVENEERLLKHLERGERAIAALWHQRVFGVIGYAKRFGKFSPAVMISQSRDGEMISQVFSRLNFRPVRGSSSRGGKAALLAMIKDLSQYPFAAHVVDGPRGPRGVVKAGLVALSQTTETPIFPVYISFSRAWMLNSWDHFLIPKPFSRIFIRWGEPIHLPKRFGEKDFEDLRLQVEQEMLVNQRQDDCRWGGKPLL
ncbi:MAG: lysophospholipid acyltransferase family protein [Deltaproteobacteria bacterium]|nr:lysophospholipid acyltransferase family protein [Deltaproteobacteria bacterium]